jgi:hypothetical protein
MDDAEYVLNEWMDDLKVKDFYYVPRSGHDPGHKIAIGFNRGNPTCCPESHPSCWFLVLYH